MDKKIIHKIINALDRNSSFLVVSHVNPDGDAIGSMGGMYYLLKEMGVLGK